MRYVDTTTVLKHANNLTEVAGQIELETKTPNGRAVAELVKTIEYFAAAMQFLSELPEPTGILLRFKGNKPKAKRKARKAGSRGKTT